MNHNLLREDEQREPFTNGKSRIATESDVKARWGGSGFLCSLCSHKFAVGDSWRWVYANGHSPSYGNFLVCSSCDGPDVLDRYNAAGKLVYALGRDSEHELIENIGAVAVLQRDLAAARAAKYEFAAQQLEHYAYQVEVEVQQRDKVPGHGSFFVSTQKLREKAAELRRLANG